MAFRWPGSRRGALPHDVAEALGIEAGERVLAWSRLTGGGHAAAGVVALRVLTERGRLIHRPWLDVDHVAWDQDSHMLAVWWVGSRSATPLELPDAEPISASSYSNPWGMSMRARCSCPVIRHLVVLRRDLRRARHRKG